MAEPRGKSVLSKPEIHGIGTRVSEYVDTPVKRECQTCEYFVGKDLCRNKIVAKDKEVKTDKKTGLKIVEPINGCCRLWEPPDEDEDDE